MASRPLLIEEQKNMKQRYAFYIISSTKIVYSFNQNVPIFI